MCYVVRVHIQIFFATLMGNFAAQRPWVHNRRIAKPEVQGENELRLITWQDFVVNVCIWTNWKMTFFLHTHTFAKKISAISFSEILLLHHGNHNLVHIMCFILSYWPVSVCLNPANSAYLQEHARTLWWQENLFHHGIWQTILSRICYSYRKLKSERWEVRAKW